MAQSLSKITEYEVQSLEMKGHPIVVVSYKVGNRYACRIENSDVGLTACTVFGATRDQAMRTGVDQAQQLFETLPEAMPTPLPSPNRTLQRVVLNKGSNELHLTIEDFLGLPLNDRMSHILGGQAAFYDDNKVRIPVGEAIELLQKTLANVDSHGERAWAV